MPTLFVLDFSLNQRSFHASLTEIIEILEAALAFYRHGTHFDVL